MSAPLITPTCSAWNTTHYPGQRSWTVWRTNNGRTEWLRHPASGAVVRYRSAQAAISAAERANSAQEVAA